VPLAIATVFGVGYVPFAPGTFGSAAGLVLWWLLPASPAAQAIAIVALFAIGAWSSGVAERHFGGTDPSYAVIDEVMGMLITLFLCLGFMMAVLYIDLMFDIMAAPYRKTNAALPKVVLDSITHCGRFASALSRSLTRC